MKLIFNLGDKRPPWPCPFSSVAPVASYIYTYSGEIRNSSLVILCIYVRENYHQRNSQDFKRVADDYKSRKEKFSYKLQNQLLGTSQSHLKVKALKIKKLIRKNKLKPKFEFLFKSVEKFQAYQWKGDFESIKIGTKFKFN